MLELSLQKPLKQCYVAKNNETIAQEDIGLCSNHFLGFISIIMHYIFDSIFSHILSNPW